MQVLYHHKTVEDNEFAAVVQTDLLWSVLSFAGVFAYSVFHTRSFLVGATGMFCSTIAYPAALLLYRAVFRVRCFILSTRTRACFPSLDHMVFVSLL